MDAELPPQGILVRCRVVLVHHLNQLQDGGGNMVAYHYHGDLVSCIVDVGFVDQAATSSSQV